MLKGFFNVPEAINEPILTYAPGTPERESLQKTIDAMRAQTMDIPMYIGDEQIHTEKKIIH